MNFEKFEKNLIDIIKESQIKLGYESMNLGINYATSSLLHMFDGVTEDTLEDTLKAFAKAKKDTFGDIDISKIDIGYRLDVSSKGVDYVHSLISDDEFLVQFINQVRNPLGTVDDIISLFKKYSDNVHIEETKDNPEFDYLIYFEDGTPDEFWYCIDAEDLGMTYHRFMKDDYLDFGF